MVIVNNVGVCFWISFIQTNLDKWQLETCSNVTIKKK